MMKENKNKNKNKNMRKKKVTNNNYNNKSNNKKKEDKGNKNNPATPKIMAYLPEQRLSDPSVFSSLFPWPLRRDLCVLLTGHGRRSAPQPHLDSTCLSLPLFVPPSLPPRVCSHANALRLSSRLRRQGKGETKWAFNMLLLKVQMRQKMRYQTMLQKWLDPFLVKSQRKEV